MPVTIDAPLLKLESQVWKARAEAKQKWLEHALAKPIRNPADAKRRALWIQRALDAVKQGQDELKHQTALLDAYAEHLGSLEMRLIQAIEEKRSAPD